MLYAYLWLTRPGRFLRVHAVREVDLRIAPGETVVLLGPNGAGKTTTIDMLLGPNGAGKTTTIDMLLGLSRPDGGEVSLFGAPPDRTVRAGFIGAMLQTGELIRDLSVRELVEMMGLCIRTRSPSMRCSRWPALPSSPASARRSCRAARRSG